MLVFNSLPRQEVDVSWLLQSMQSAVSPDHFNHGVLETRLAGHNYYGFRQR